jgi:SAM-dependent methyltransferase
MDIEQAFNEDYLYFYEGMLGGEQSDRDAELLWSLLALERGAEVLDLACGHGRIANRLAARGARVTGLDATPLFLERAREDATERGVEVEYVLGDMRELPWEARFDVVLSWFTSFGYFDDDGNRAVLAAAFRALRPGGRLVVDVNNLLMLMRVFRPADAVERDGDLMVDRRRYDVETGRIVFERFAVRGGTTRRTEFAVRAFTFTELRDWLLATGFDRVGGYGRDGQPLTLDHNRMVLVASKPR